MRLVKNLKVWLIAMGLLVFTAGSVQAGGCLRRFAACLQTPPL
jgi:hypothetical protein